MNLARGTGLAGLIFVVGGCGGPPPSVDWEIPDLPRWEVAAEPSLSIGVVDGDPNYQLFRASSAVRIGDSLVVVANTGTRELRYFDRSGRFLTRAGGYGEGPGEFRWLRNVRLGGPDTIVAFDISRRLTFFDYEGEYLGIQPAGQLSRFPFDWWLYRKNFVIGVAAGDERVAVARSLDLLPLPPTPPGFWYVHRDPAGFLWVSNGPGPDGGRRMWTVFDERGGAHATVELPAGFEIFEITSRDLLGRWRDDVGVEYIRTYGLQRGALSDPVRMPAAANQASVTREGGDATAIQEVSYAVLRQAVTQQERFFGGNMRYTANRHDLDWELPEGVTLDFLSVSGRGWVGVMTHRDSPVICGIGLGMATPPGWPEGAPVCADTDPAPLERSDTGARELVR